LQSKIRVIFNPKRITRIRLRAKRVMTALVCDRFM
jgi:hypothetical protein